MTSGHIIAAVFHRRREMVLGWRQSTSSRNVRLIHLSLLAYIYMLLRVRPCTFICVNNGQNTMLCDVHSELALPKTHRFYER